MHRWKQEDVPFSSNMSSGYFSRNIFCNLNENERSLETSATYVWVCFIFLLAVLKKKKKSLNRSYM